MPARVRLSLLLLWVAWSVSVGALVLRLVATHGAVTDAYARAGVGAALAQAALFYFLARRSATARLMFLWLAAPALVVVLSRFSADVSWLRLGVETALRASAWGLLVGRDSAAWFRDDGARAHPVCDAPPRSDSN